MVADEDPHVEREQRRPVPDLLVNFKLCDARGPQPRRLLEPVLRPRPVGRVLQDRLGADPVPAVGDRLPRLAACGEQCPAPQAAALEEHLVARRELRLVHAPERAPCSRRAETVGRIVAALAIHMPSCRGDGQRRAKRGNYDRSFRFHAVNYIIFRSLRGEFSACLHGADFAILLILNASIVFCSYATFFGSSGLKRKAPQKRRF